MANDSAAGKAAEYCLLWIDALCAESKDWPGWLQVALGLATLIATIAVVAWQRRRDAGGKVAALLPSASTAAHYIASACAHAEKGDRSAPMDITREKLKRLRDDLALDVYAHPSGEVAQVVADLRIALGRAVSGLGQWAQESGSSTQYGLQDLQRARQLSADALRRLKKVRSR